MGWRYMAGNDLVSAAEIGVYRYCPEVWRVERGLWSKARNRRRAMPITLGLTDWRLGV
jgi:hypothetical protein